MSSRRTDRERERRRIRSRLVFRIVGESKVNGDGVSGSIRTVTACRASCAGTGGNPRDHTRRGRRAYGLGPRAATSQRRSGARIRESITRGRGSCDTGATRHTCEVRGGL